MTHRICVLKVEIPKHELEHSETVVEEEDDHTQFEVDMVGFENK